MSGITIARAAAGAAWILAVSSAHAAEITRTPAANPTIPLSAAVAVPAGHDLIFISGSLPEVADPKAPKGSAEAYGNTETQTLSVLKRLGDTLRTQGLTFADVVSSHVFLVGDPRNNGEIDFAGLNAGFSKFFGTPEQPNKPARSTVKVAGLVVPGALVEIELIAARPSKTK
jgi:enamine deaminase RidA (YjgF/YER057c/UK114 family)